jgi:hypothetical protein
MKERKMRGVRDGEVPVLTQLKVRWRGMAQSARERWRERLDGPSTQAELRKLIRAEMHLELKRDTQLTDFRAWLEEQDARDQEAERQKDDEIALAQAHPDWDADRLRSEVIAASMRRAIATGDFKGLGLKAVKAGQNERVLSLDERKLRLLEERARKADEAEGITRSTASNEEKVARMRALFGMG